MERVVSSLRGGLITAAAFLSCVGAVAGQATRTAPSLAERRAVEGATRLREAGRLPDATRALEEFLVRQPVSPTALALLVDLLAEEGDVGPVLAWVERAVGQGANDPQIQRLWVSSLVQAGFGDSARAVARRWVQVAPSLAEAHLALTDAELAVADTSTAIRVLEHARDDLNEAGAILERLADLYVASGDRAGLLESWGALLALGESGVVAVVEDVRSSPKSRRDAMELWDTLLQRSEQESLSRGAYAALRLGEPRAARRLARVSQPTDVADRSRFLRGYVSEATDGGLPGEVAWGADELASLSTRPADRQRWQAVSADMALVAGDTSAARRTFRTLLEESEPGDAAHRLASRRLFSVLASAAGDVSGAAGLWESYRQTYPDSALDLAEMAAELSDARARVGALEEAERGLRDARVSLSSAAARATLDDAGTRLALFRGQPDSAIARLVRATAAPGVEPVARTRDLSLLALLEGANAPEIELLGGALLALLRDPAGWETDAWLRRFAGLPATTARPAMLALLADELDSAGRSGQASRALHHIVDAFPRSPQTPAALLSLARRATRIRPDSARTWLERLITTYPESAVAPLARRLLAELGPVEPPGRGG